MGRRNPVGTADDRVMAAATGPIGPQRTGGHAPRADAVIRFEGRERVPRGEHRPVAGAPGAFGLQASVGGVAPSHHLAVAREGSEWREAAARAKALGWQPGRHPLHRNRRTGAGVMVAIAAVARGEVDGTCRQPGGGEAGSTAGSTAGSAAGAERGRSQHGAISEESDRAARVLARNRSCERGGSTQSHLALAGFEGGHGRSLHHY